MFLSRTFGIFFLVSLTACWGYCSSETRLRIWKASHQITSCHGCCEVQTDLNVAIGCQSARQTWQNFLILRISHTSHWVQTQSWSCHVQAGWILILLSYTTHAMIPYNKGGHPLSPDLFLIGMASWHNLVSLFLHFQSRSESKPELARIMCTVFCLPVQYIIRHDIYLMICK